MSPTKRRLALLCSVLTLVAGGAWALGFDSFSPVMGVIVIPRPDLVDSLGYPASGPSIVTNILGSDSRLTFDEHWSWEPGLDFYWTYHLWSPENNRALPAEIEHRTAFTLGFILAMPFVLRFELPRDFSVAIGLGPGFHLRAGLRDSVVPIAEAPDVDKINAWFYANGRWFVPETLLRASYKLTDRLAFSFAALAFWPIFNTWNNAPMLLDDGIYGGALSVRYMLR